MIYLVELYETFRAFSDIEAPTAVASERLAEDRLASGELSLADIWSKCDRSARVVFPLQNSSHFL